MKTSFILILIVFISLAHASFEKKGIGASNTGLSQSGVASDKLEFCMFTNPALISGQSSVDFFYRNFFGIKELNQIAVNSEFSLFDQALGLGIIRYGNNLYSETELTFGGSYQPQANFSMGLSFSMYFLQIKNYGNAFSIGLNFAVFYMLNDQLNIAGAIQNVNEPDIGPANEKIPVSAVLGLSYSPVRDVEILVDSYKEEFYDFAYRLGTRIRIISKINLLAGFQDNINSFSFGLELTQNNYTFKYSVDIHPVLSLSHAIGIGYVF